MNTLFKFSTSRFTRSLVPAAMIAALILPTGSAVAKLASNGISVNGIQSNGVQVNGLSLNGHRPSGTALSVSTSDVAAHLPAPHCTPNPTECVGWIRAEVPLPAGPSLVLPSGTILQLR